MRLGDLVDGSLDLTPDEAGIEITGLTADSRAVAPGMLFAALPGSKVDGARFVADALRAGAAAILAGTGAEIAANTNAPILHDADPRRRLAKMAARFFGRQPATMAAVTGTAGKTSVAAFTRQIWQRAGYRAAMIGTIGVVTDEAARYGNLTTPDPVVLHRLLAELADAGIDHAVMEASSHGLDQRRLDGVRLSAGAFTNLGRDHMDYHPDVEHYLAAKMRLFEVLLPDRAPVVIDTDGAYADRAIACVRERGLPLFTVGTRGDDLRLDSVSAKGFGQDVNVICDGQNHALHVPLVGRFQISNALVAAGLAIVTGVAPDTALLALEKLEGAPGRLDHVGSTEDGALAFVDYAHKPDALEHALTALKAHADGRLIVVIGAGGDRDRGKRPLMGEIAARLADAVIVTDDNPRSEDPAAIRAAILAAAPGAQEIGDRAAAIRAGVALLSAGDVLLVAGKGHEPGQIVGDVTLPFSDHDEVRAALRESEGR